MSKVKLSKTQNKNKKKNKKNALNTLVADENNADKKVISSKTDKPLLSLEKIKKQLNDLIAQRSHDQDHFTKLEQSSDAISRQIKQTEALLATDLQQSKQLVDNDLNEIKVTIDKEKNQFSQTTEKLKKEITTLNDLVSRVDTKISRLKKEVSSKQSLTDKVFGNKPNSEDTNKAQKKESPDNPFLLKKITQFEEQLNQFKDTGFSPKESSGSFSNELKKLNKFVKKSTGKYKDHDIQLDLLQNHISEIKTLLKQKPSKIKNAAHSDIKQHTSDISNLTDKTDSMTVSVAKLSQNLESWKHDFKTQVSKQSESALTSAQQIIEQLSIQKGNIQKQFAEKNKQYNQQIQSLHDTIINLQEKQKEPVEPLKNHVRELKHNIDSLQESYKKQQQVITADAENLRLLNGTITQFNEQLQNSHEELQEYVQQLRNSDNNKNSQQFNELNQTFESLSQQFVSQQEQLRKYDEQFINLNPLLNISDNINTLKFNHNELSEQEDILQASLSTLADQVNSDYAKQQKSLDKILHEQESELAVVEQLNERLTTRSQLFLAGLVASMALSSALFYYHNKTHKSSVKETSSHVKQDLMSGKSNTQLNDFLKQNNDISQQFATIDESIADIKQKIKQQEQEQEQLKLKQQKEIQGDEVVAQSWQAEFKALENNWQKKYDLLQGNINQTETERESLKQTLNQFSNSVDSVILQINQLQQDPSLATAAQPSDQPLAQPAPRSSSPEEPAIIDIESIKQPFYGIQLLGAKNKKLLIRFAQKNNLSGSSQIVKTQHNEASWYILIQGQYSKYSVAKKGLKKLKNSSEALKNSQPWIKRLP